MIALKIAVVSALIWWVFRGMALNLLRQGISPTFPALAATLAGLTGIVSGLIAGWQWIFS
jgi:hypothetical protein